MIAEPPNNSIPHKFERVKRSQGQRQGEDRWKVNLVGEKRLAVSSGALTLLIIPIV